MIEVDSVISFLQEINNEHAVMYRGHAKSEWDILPSIARINPKELDRRYESGWEGIENALLSAFTKNALKYLSKEPKNKLEWMIQAQHHGVPTRLLDWTTNPLKALYFAVENPYHDHSDGIVYFLLPSMWRDSPGNIDVDSDRTISMFHPITINERIAAQEGCFSLFPQQKKPKSKFTPLNTGFSPAYDIIHLGQLRIKKDAKPEIRKQLNKLGISDSSMFPGLDGVAKDIKRNFKCL